MHSSTTPSPHVIHVPFSAGDFTDPTNLASPLFGFKRLKKLILVVTTGRSGSLFVANLVNENATNASAEHEPDIGSVDKATQWYYARNESKLDRLVRKKLARLRRGERFGPVPPKLLLSRKIRRSPFRKVLPGLLPRVSVKDIYVEVNNGFLKSFGPALLKAVPSVEIIHLTRHPLEVARSAENRGTEPQANGRPYYLWPTWRGNELPLDAGVMKTLNRFQLALWYWFEMELRYVSMCKRHWHGKTSEVDLNSLNDPRQVEALFGACGIEYRPISTRVDRHLGPRKSVITEEDRRDAEKFLEHVPTKAFSAISNTYGLEQL